MDIAHEIARFDAGIPLAEAVTPPASWYTEPEFLALERRTVFRRNWLVLCRREQLAEPGRFVSGRFAGAPWVALRQAEGGLRAFHNVCRHHAAEICHGEGSLERLVCPYHGWTYDLDGGLLKAPGLGAARNFERGDFALPKIAAEELGPYVYGRLGESAATLPASLGAMHALLAETRYEDLNFVRRFEYEFPCNWKVFVDNYLDGGYHIPYLHRGLDAELEMANYRSELHERFNVQSCNGRRGERVGERALYIWAHPNFMLNRYGPILDTNTVLPLAHDRTLVRVDFFIRRGEGEAAQRFLEESMESTNRIQHEDIGICESVQRGLASGAYEVGRYSVTHEAPMHHFHRLLAADYTGELVQR